MCARGGPIFEHNVRSFCTRSKLSYAHVRSYQYFKFCINIFKDGDFTHTYKIYFTVVVIIYLLYLSRHVTASQVLYWLRVTLSL